MKAVVFEKKGKLVLTERPRPCLERDTDVLVRVTLTTICSSDIHIKHGAVPNAVPGTILGHEFVGVVEETGKAVKKVKPGDRVAVNVETFCGSCFYCERGFVNNCSDPLGGWALGCRIDGGQAEYVDSVSDEAALFTGDLLSTGYWAARIGEISKGDTVAVIGAGPAGLCTMMCARLYDPGKIIALDTDENRLNRLDVVKDNHLADFCINPGEISEKDLETQIRELSHGRGADRVFEVAGGKDTFQTAWKIARPNAVVTLVAMYEEDQRLPLPSMYGKNLVFKTGGVDGCYCDQIMDLIQKGELDTSPLITHRTTLEHIMEAYEIFEKKQDGVIKFAIKV